MSRRNRFEIGTDDRNDARELVFNQLASMERISTIWNEVRQQQTGPMFIFPEALMDLLDDIADINLCSHEDCRKLCKEDWDFCEEHGAVTDDLFSHPIDPTTKLR